MLGHASDGPSTSRPRWVTALDGVLDGLVLAFVGWTIWYEFDLWTQWSLWWPARIWLLLSVLIVVGCAIRSVRADNAPRNPSPADPPGVDEVSRGPAPTRSARPAAALVYVAAVVLLLLMVAMRARIGVTPLALVGIAILVAGLVRAVRSLRGPTPYSGGPGQLVRPEQECSPLSHAVAAAASLALGILASLMVKTDADDVFYVNRATWVAEHGTPTLKDTMFSPGRLPSVYMGGLQLPSIESLQGAVAGVLHLQAATFTYEVTVPVLAAVSGWATWRLVRMWAPRQTLLVFAAALVFMLFSAESIVGNYSVGRIWQGKVTAFAIVIPLVWYHFSALLQRSALWNQLMLLALGIAFVGLTSTAALLAPVIAAAALLGACILRERALAVGAGLMVLAPLVAGGILALAPVPVAGENPVPLPVEASFAIMLGSSTGMVAVGLVGVVFGVRLAPGRLSVLAACGSLATMTALLPGVIDLVNSVTGSGPITWRLLLGIPTWVLVGMLFAAPVPGFRIGSNVATPRLVNGLRVVLASTIALVVVLTGTPIWSPDAGAQLVSRSTWKVEPKALADVRAVSHLQARRGLWLLPPPQMEILSIATTKISPVVARGFYLHGLQVSPIASRDRRVLLELAAGYDKPVPRVRRALRRLDVAVACVPAASVHSARTLSRAVGEPLRRVGSLGCHVERRHSSD